MYFLPNIKTQHNSTTKTTIYKTKYVNGVKVSIALIISSRHHHHHRRRLTEL
jgi:hypothetical protein